MNNKTITLQVRDIDAKLHTEFKIKCLRNCQGQREAITELMEWYIKEPKLKKDE